MGPPRSSGQVVARRRRPLEGGGSWGERTSGSDLRGQRSDAGPGKDGSIAQPRSRATPRRAFGLESTLRSATEICPVSAPETEYYRLRTEWLRFKSHLFDSLTGLPTLPAVVEDIRRVAESRGWADVVYL